jgi:hypothetical protein
LRWLDQFLDGVEKERIDPDRLDAITKASKEEGASNATINRTFGRGASDAALGGAEVKLDNSGAVGSHASGGYAARALLEARRGRASASGAAGPSANDGEVDLVDGVAQIGVSRSKRWLDWVRFRYP